MQTKIQTLSDDVIDSYLKGDEQTKAPAADDLKGAKQEEQKKEETSEVKIDETPVDKSEKKVVQTLSEEDEKVLGADVKKEDETSDKPKKVSKGDIEGAINYKDIVSYMIDEDGWEPVIKLENGQEVDLKEVADEEFTPEVYANLLKYQNSVKVSRAIQEEKAQYGNQAAELLDYLRDGGKLEDIAQFYQASKDINSLNTETEEGQESIIREYFKSTTSKPDSWIDEQVEMLKDKGADRFKKEALDNKTLLLEAIKEQQEETLTQQKEIESQRKDRENRYNQAIREAIHKDNLPEREKRDNEKYAFEYKFPHPTNPNVKVSQFYLDFNKIQSDPSKQYRLQQIIKNFDKFENKEKVETDTKVKLHTFLRKNQSTLTKPTTESPEYENNKSNSPFDWEKINKYLKK